MLKSQWHCPENCPGLPSYGGECPDDLLGDEPCPLGVFDEDENKISKKENVKMAEQTTKVVTGKVRLSYAYLFNPRTPDDPNDKPKYSVSILIPKSDVTTLRKIKAAVEAAKEAGKSSKWGGKLPTGLKLPLRDGDTERPDNLEYHGHYFFNASSTQKPGIVDANLNAILDQTEVYSGCYGRVSVNFYPFNTKGSKGVAAGLNNVQKLEDGEPLGGVPSRPEDDFDAVGDVGAGADDDFLS